MPSGMLGIVLQGFSTDQASPFGRKLVRWETARFEIGFSEIARSAIVHSAIVRSAIVRF